MYLIENHHPAIVNRKTFDAVQAELARRKAGKSPTKAASTGLTSYASKYALSERLVCGECGTLYRRCTWKRGGQTRIVWRCVSRLDYGKRYCHNSPTLEEGPLQRAILAAVNKAMSQKDTLTWKITRAMEKEVSPIPGEEMSFADIEKRLAKIDREVGQLLPKAVREGEEACREQLGNLLTETTILKEKRAFLQEQRERDSAAARRMETVAAAMEQLPVELTRWEESTIRQLVDTVKVLSKDSILVCLRCGVQVEQKIER